MDGAIKKWGWGERGQLGLGNTNDQTIPQTVSLGPDIQNKEASLNVYCGSGFTFAIRSLSVNPDNISRNFKKKRGSCVMPKQVAFFRWERKENFFVIFNQVR